MTGIRAELAVDRPQGCPVARASSRSPQPVREVRWTEGDDGTVEQFEAAGDVEEPSVERVFDYGDRAVYEFDRNGDSPCFCDAVESRVGPVTDVVAHNGTLRVTVHAGDVAGLRDAFRELTETYGDVSLESIVRADPEDSPATVVPVDLSRLTDRQQEVLETAFEMGYFAYPRDSNATEVADELGIDPSTFTEHLTVAQNKLFEALLES
jgi:predicted DNA binding protein